ncbi:MAG: hypothetical protein ACKO03_00165 [Bacteroidota bacterium]
MNQTTYKWMLFIVLILLISNVVMAFFLFGDEIKGGSKKGKGEDMAMKVYREIGLDSDQVKVFLSSKEEYFKQMRPVWGEIKKLKDSLYQQMEMNSSDSIVNGLLNSITERNRYADSFTYDHFSKLRVLCTPDQQARFDTIIPKLINRSRRR